jgi:hypothetical protein
MKLVASYPALQLWYGLLLLLFLLLLLLLLLPVLDICVSILELIILTHGLALYKVLC